jgi:hypothetical protein
VLFAYALCVHKLIFGVKFVHIGIYKCESMYNVCININIISFLYNYCYVIALSIVT